MFKCQTNLPDSDVCFRAFIWILSGETEYSKIQNLDYGRGLILWYRMLKCIKVKPEDSSADGTDLCIRNLNTSVQ